MTAKSASIFHWSMYDDRQQPASVCVFFQGSQNASLLLPVFLY